MDGFVFTFLTFIFCIGALIGLAFIPARIARQKGYDYATWWVFGFFLWLVALIVALVMEDKNARKVPYFVANPVHPPAAGPMPSVADELKKYKELLEQGAINEEEYAQAKEKLLKS